MSNRPLFPTAAPLPQVLIDFSEAEPADHAALDEEIRRTVNELYTLATRLPVIEFLRFQAIGLPYRIILYPQPRHPHDLSAIVLPKVRP